MTFNIPLGGGGGSLERKKRVCVCVCDVVMLQAVLQLSQ